MNSFTGELVPFIHDGIVNNNILLRKINWKTLHNFLKHFKQNSVSLEAVSMSEFQRNIFHHRFLAKHTTLYTKSCHCWLVHFSLCPILDITIMTSLPELFYAVDRLNDIVAPSQHDSPK